MGTLADIGRLKEDGSYDYFHLRYDGDLPHTGACLFKHYSTPETLDALFTLTAVTCLESHVEQMEDLHWLDEDDLGAAAPETLTYLFRDNSWWYHGYYSEEGAEESDDDEDDVIGWYQITREMLIRYRASIGDYLDSTEYEPSTQERMRERFKGYTADEQAALGL